ncbi:hypothetical protein JCM10213_008357 [Rhodosporidiobolus nylandii]
MASIRTLLPRLGRAVTPVPRLRIPSPSPLASVWRPSRALHSSLPRFEQSQPPAHTLNGPKTPIGRIDPLDRRLQITFTCTAVVPVDNTPEGRVEGAPARQCGHRSSHEFSRRSYEKGVVIVQCPGCENRHLIADHLHWFSSTPSPAHPHGQDFTFKTPRTVEDLMREKGEEVQWVVRERTEADGGKTIEMGEATEGEVAQAKGEEGK